MHARCDCILAHAFDEVDRLAKRQIERPRTRALLEASGCGLKLVAALCAVILLLNIPTQPERPQRFHQIVANGQHADALWSEQPLVPASSIEVTTQCMKVNTKLAFGVRAVDQSQHTGPPRGRAQPLDRQPKSAQAGNVADLRQPRSGSQQSRKAVDYLLGIQR